MKISQRFQVGKDEIAYIGDSFKEDFYEMEFKEDASPLYSKKLGKVMNFQEIQTEFNPTEVTLGQLFRAMKKGEMEKDAWGYLAQVKNKRGVGRIVRVYWNDEGWYWYSYPLDDTNEWDDDRRVFSGNSRFGPQETPDPLNPLTLEISEIVVNGKTYRLVK